MREGASSLIMCIELLSMMTIGYTAIKIRMVKKDFVMPLAMLLLNVFTPCTILASMLTTPGNGTPGDDFVLLLLGFGITVLCSVIAGAAAMLTRKTLDRSLTFVSVAFMNAGVIGLPLINTWYGADGVRVASILLVPLSVLCAVVSPLLIRRDDDGKDLLKSIAKSVLSPITLSAAAGIILYMCRIQMPNAIFDVLNRLSGATLPLGMILCGMVVGTIRFKETRIPFHALLCAFIRAVVCPALAFAALRLMCADEMLVKIAVIFTAMPMPQTLLLLACREPERGQSASIMLFCSLVLSCITIPCWQQLLDVL